MNALTELQSVLFDRKEGMIEGTYLELSNKVLEIYKTITSLYTIDYIETEISRTSPSDYQILSRPKKIILQLNEFELELITKMIEINAVVNQNTCQSHTGGNILPIVPNPPIDDAPFLVKRNFN